MTERLVATEPDAEAAHRLPRAPRRPADAGRRSAARRHRAAPGGRRRSAQRRGGDDAGAAARAGARSRRAGARCSTTRWACCATTSSAASWTSTRCARWSALLTLRERPRAAAAVAELVAALAAAEAAAGAPAGAPGRSLAALRRPSSTSGRSRPGCRPGVRQIMRLRRAAPAPERRRAGAAARRATASRASDRAGRGEAPRPLFDGVAAELGAGDFELYVQTGRLRRGSGPAARRARHRPPPIIVGAPLVAMGPGALRFAAARTLRLCATNLDAILAVPPEEAAALLVGIIRQFVPDYRHPGVRDALVELEAARAARLIPRKLKPAVSCRSRSRARGRSTWPRCTPRCATAPTRPACWRRRSAGRACGRASPASGMRNPTFVAVADRRTPGSAGAAAFRRLRRLRRAGRGDGGVEAKAARRRSLIAGGVEPLRVPRRCRRDKFGVRCPSEIPARRPTIR